jgi:GT2 family glycosyltransferase
MSAPGPDPTRAGSVCAVVVTFNRKDLLRDCLRSLERQERPLDAILVVDNASTDGTAELLKDEFSHLHVLTLPENRGGAGGYREGVRWAFEKGFDWMWLLDDDVEATPDALAGTLRFAPLSDFLIPRRRHAGKPVEWESIIEIHRFIRSLPAKDTFSASKRWTVVRVACFEGALVHRRVVEKIGYPDARYFIMGDDFMYGLRASFHTNVVYCDHFALERKFPPTPSFSKRAYYFGTRNRFLIYEDLRELGLAVPRFEFLFVLLADALRSAVGIATHRERRKLDNLRGLLLGLWDGLRGRTGRPAWM